MIFKSLYIFPINGESILKEYRFKEKGVNIILGEKKDPNDETNGVGKSTMIDCISFLLGKSISSYYSNNKILIEKDIFIALEVKLNDEILFLGRSFNNPRNGYILDSKELSLNLNDWTRIKLKDFKSFVEDKILNKNSENVTFSALREYIIRDEKTGFNDIFLPNRGPLKQHIILNYLFSLPYLSELKIKSLRDIIENMNNKVKLIEAMKLNITGLKVKEEEIFSSIVELNHTIEHAKTTSHYNKSTSEYTTLKKKLNEVQTKIFEYEHICNQYQKNIDNLQEKVNEIKQLEDVEKFYDDLVGFFPENVKENYTKVREFYDFMVESRGNYFKNKISTLKVNVKKLYTDKQELEKELEETTKILKSENYIEDISIVMDKKRQKEIELAEIRIRLKDYNQKNEIVEDINEIQHEILRINSMHYDEFLSFQNKKNELQSIFNELMAVTYNQHGFLDFEYNNRISYSNNSTTGRIKISCSIPDERSHGRLHMKINMFDLTWFLYRNINNLGVNFLIHDGSYSNPDQYVKGVLLKYLEQKLKECPSGQYFVTLNRTELLKQDLKELEDAGVVTIKLDRLNNDSNRFFGFKF